MRCSTIEVWPDEPDEQCTLEAVVMVTTGCVHEHLRVDPMCGRCLTKARLGEQWCEPCEPFCGDACKVRALAAAPLSEMDLQSTT